MARISAAERREQFLEAAVAVIARDGVDGATTRKIADEARAPLATLHYCFQTKENLLFALYEQLFSEIRVETPAALATGASAARPVEDLMTETMQWVVDHPVRARATIEITLWAERNDPGMAGRLYALFLEAWSELLLRAGIPLPAEAVETFVRLLIAIADGLTLQMIAEQDAERTMRDTATACRVLKAYLEVSSSKAA